MAPRIVVLGAGGLGSVIGGWLADAGADVTLVGRPAHVEAIRRNGLRITGHRGEKFVRDNLTAVDHPKEAPGDFDYLFLTVKSKDTAIALDDASILQDRVAAALSFQNSVTKDEILAQWIGRDRVIGAATIEPATLVAPGEVTNHFTVTVTAWFGELDGRSEPSGRVTTLVDAFDAAGLSARAADDIVHVEWEKLAQICAASSWFCTTLAAAPGVNFRHVLGHREAAEHFVTINKEVLSVYKALGYTPQNFFAPLSRLADLDAVTFEEAVELVMRHMGPVPGRPASNTSPSMYGDLMRRRKTEVDVILGPFIAAAAEQSIDVPVLLSAYRVLRSLNRCFEAS